MSVISKRYQHTPLRVKSHGVRVSHRQLSKLREAIYQLRSYVERDGADIAAVVNEGLLTHFKSNLRRKHYAKLQLDVLWILLNIAFECKYANKIFDASLMDRYYELLKAPSYALQHHTLWLLAIGAGTSVELRNHIMSSTLDDIANIIQSEFDKTQCTDYGELPQEYDKLMAMASTVVYTFCDKGHHSKDEKQKLVQMIEYLLLKYGTNYKLTFDLSQSQDTNDIIEIRSQMVWSLYALVINQNTNEYKAFIRNLWCNPHIVKELIYFLSSNNDHIIDGIIRCFGSILQHNSLWDPHVSMCIRLGLLPAIKRCMNKYMRVMEMRHMNESQKEIMEGLCWLMSQIAADSIASVEALAINNLFLDCIELMLNNENIDIMIVKQASNTLTNAVMHCNEAMIEHLVNNGLMDAMVEYTSMEMDDECTRRILNGLKCIFGHKNNGAQYTQLFANKGGCAFLQNIKEGATATDGIFTLNEWKANKLIGKYFGFPSFQNKNSDWFTFDVKYILNQS